MTHETYFWYYLLKVCEVFEDIDPESEQAWEQLLMQLDTMDEIFRRSFDPVDDFEKYSVMAFATTVRKVLSSYPNKMGGGKEERHD